MSSLPLKNRANKTRKTFGFTLVELIVVITILVILGTIAFTSLQGFSGSARDSARIENLANLDKGLSLFQIVSGMYPMPENPVNITASGTIIGYQGFAKDQVGSIAKLSPWATKDPLDAMMYTTYYVNVNQTKMQIMAFLEDGNIVTSYIPTANASTTSDYSKRFPITIGDALWILLNNGTAGTKNQPVQELLSVSFTGVDVVNTNSGYLAYVNQKKTISGTGTILKVLTANNQKSSLTYALSCKDINDNGFSIWDGIYYINPTGTGIFQVYCDMSTDGGGWTLWMKFKSVNSIFWYDSSYWNDDITYNENDLNLNDADAKFKAFSISNGTQLKFCIENNGIKCNNINYSWKLKTFAALNTSIQIWYGASLGTGTWANSENWINNFWFSSYWTPDCEWQNFDTYSFVKIWVVRNDWYPSGSCTTSDFSWGFWLKNSHSNLQWWAWYVDSYSSNFKRWYIYIR